MNQAQMQNRALMGELNRAREYIAHLKAEAEKQKSIETFLAAALTGACSRLTDPAEAARFALAATDQIVQALAGAVGEHSGDELAEADGAGEAAAGNAAEENDAGPAPAESL